MRRAGGPFGVFGVEQPTLKINQSGLLNTILIKGAPLAPSRITNASVGEKLRATECKEAAVTNEHQGTEDKTVEI